MRRSLLALALVLVALSPTAAALRVDGPPVLEQGDLWEFAFTGERASGGKAEATERREVDAVEGYSGVEAVKTVSAVTQTYRVGRPDQPVEFRSTSTVTTWTRAADGAVLRVLTESSTQGPGGTAPKVSRTDVAYTPPCVRLQWPLEVGRTWTSRCEAVVIVEGQTATEATEVEEYTVVGEEAVTTPAGVFQALVIENGTAGQSGVTRQWYAPRACGAVRTVGAPGYQNATSELASFACAGGGATHDPSTASDPVAPTSPEAGIRGGDAATPAPAAWLIAAGVAAAAALAARGRAKRS